MSFDLVALAQEKPAAPSARPRRSLDLETESVVRVLPIRWRLLSMATLNATVAVILAALIWNGANVLSRAWDDVRKVRESDKLLVQLESESSRLQNLIHRYINQPSQEVLAEILRAARRGSEHVAQSRRAWIRCFRGRRTSCAR